MSTREPFSRGVARERHFSRDDLSDIPGEMNGEPNNKGNNNLKKKETLLLYYII